jgi:hypothetical protein
MRGPEIQKKLVLIAKEGFPVVVAKFSFKPFSPLCVQRSHSFVFLGKSGKRVRVGNGFQPPPAKAPSSELFMSAAEADVSPASMLEFLVVDSSTSRSSPPQFMDKSKKQDNTRLDNTLRNIFLNNCI